MKVSGIISLIALTFLTIGPPGATAAPARDTDRPPDDFAVVYHWQTGTVSPLYCYSYDVTIKAGGQGEVAIVPGYTPEGDTVWNEPFTVSPAEREKLYRALVEKGLFKIAWKSMDRSLLGSGSESLTVKADGKTVEIPANLVPECEGPAQDIFSMVKGMAPQSIWDGLQPRLERFRKEHAR